MERQRELKIMEQTIMTEEAVTQLTQAAESIATRQREYQKLTEQFESAHKLADRLKRQATNLAGLSNTELKVAEDALANASELISKVEDFDLKAAIKEAFNKLHHAKNEAKRFHEAHDHRYNKDLRKAAPLP